MKKDLKNKTLCGVCSGLARSLNINPLWIRLLFVFFFLHLGMGLLLYVILALLMPSDEV